MLANVRGLVDGLELSPNKATMPLFEAISNAFDAIEQKGLGVTKGTVHIELIANADLVQQAGSAPVLIDGFSVTDDGVGFDETNMASFGEAFTRSKVTLGGKGVGRFTFLKVFKHVEIRSVFERSGARFARSFRFSIDHEVEGADKLVPTRQATGSTVRLTDMDEAYRSAWPHDPEALADKIITHFLIRFAARSCPRVLLEPPGRPGIDLQEYFQKHIALHIEERTFRVLEHEFALQAFRHSGRSRHTYHLCANGRGVVPLKLRDLMPELPDRFIDEDREAYVLTVLVTGEYFDRHVNQARTQIAFQSDVESDIDSTLVPRSALNAGIAQCLRSVLVADMRNTNEEKLAQITEFAVRAPEYRMLTHGKYREMIEQRVPPGLAEDKLDEALLHLRREIEDSVRREERHVAALMESESFEQYQDRIRILIERMNDVGKSKLADYIAHRRTILDLVGSSLKRVKTDKAYPLEKVLHKLIFPMTLTSKDIFLEQQNLWLIDERLCFHTLLTSDKKLNQVPGLECTSGKEPDIFAFFYDTPIGVAEPGNLPGGCIVIIEFKRPGKDDYSKDPADQIIQRFVEVVGGGIDDIDGRPINPEGLRFIGYLIADLTPSLRKHVAMRYHKMADNEGYFSPLADGKGYVEIISYDKLLSDAKRRNRVLFEKLGLHKD